MLNRRPVQVRLLHKPLILEPHPPEIRDSHSPPIPLRANFQRHSRIKPDVPGHHPKSSSLRSNQIPPHFLARRLISRSPPHLRLPMAPHPHPDSDKTKQQRQRRPSSRENAQQPSHAAILLPSVCICAPSVAEIRCCASPLRPRRKIKFFHEIPHGFRKNRCARRQKMWAFAQQRRIYGGAHFFLSEKPRTRSIYAARCYKCYRMLHSSARPLSLGPWPLDLGHSLVIGPWPLVIHPRAQTPPRLSQSQSKNRKWQIPTAWPSSSSPAPLLRSHPHPAGHSHPPPSAGSSPRCARCGR